MAEVYAYITNFNDVSDIILRISLVCIIIYTIINIIKKHKEKKVEVVNNKSVNLEKRITIIDFIGGITLSVLMILFSLYLIKIGKIISYIAIPSTIFIIYVVYLRPILKLNDEPFVYNYSLYGFILVMAIWINSKIDYLEYFQQIGNESVSQVMAIIFVLIQTYTIFYCLIVNCYFLIKSFAKFNISKFEDIFSKFRKHLERNISYDNIELTFEHTNELFYGDKKKILKLLLIIPFFIFDIIRCMILYLLSYLFTTIINPICIFIKFILKILNKISNTNENKINYGISKITLILSFVITYLLIQLNNTIFQERIIATYEYISTAILIPIILESLLSTKGNLELLRVKKK
ncbi:MAG: hypothetical protein ACI4VR_05860 [Bacilli bacterium]